MEKNLSFFERYLSVWVFLCIFAGILLGKAAPEIATTLNDFSFHQVSIPIALCLFFVMYPIMVKIDFSQVLKSAKTPKPTEILRSGLKSSLSAKFDSKRPSNAAKAEVHTTYQHFEDRLLQMHKDIADIAMKTCKIIQECQQTVVQHWSRVNHTMGELCKDFLAEHYRFMPKHDHQYMERGVS